MIASAESPPGSRPVILHASDVRLGGAFPFLRGGGAAHRAQLRETLVRLVEHGISIRASLVLVTGNLFGVPCPPRELAEFARGQIGRLTNAGIPVLVAAGPLDAPRDGNYGSGALADMERVSVFPIAPRAITLPALETTVVGISWNPSAPSDVLDALSGHLSGQRGSRFLVAACAIPWPESDEGVKALRRQIAASGADYVALGGSPARHDLSVEGVAAWCPGSPELAAPEGGGGSLLVVRFNGGVAVTPTPIATRRFAEFILQPAAFATPQALADAIRALADGHLAARVRLAGPSRINQYVDVAELRNELAPSFLSLDIVDESRPAIEDLDAATYPELSVAGKFVKVVRAEMERATTEEARRRAGAALRLGLALLEGRRPS